MEGGNPPVADATDAARKGLKRGNVVLLYASMYNDMHIIVSLYVRFNLEIGMETRLGKDFLQAIKRDGFIDPAHEKIGVVDTQLIVHQGVPSLGNQGECGASLCVNLCVNLSGRFNLERGMETSLVKDFLQAI
ncbi:hypothetical protein ACFE04_026095 [Oxalis oulophora]